MRPVRSTLLACLIVAAVTAPTAYGVSIAAAPTTTVAFDPAIPDGLSGWWRTAPAVSVTCDQAATVYYRWTGSSQATLAVSAGVPAFIGSAPQGTNVLTVYSVNAAEETETPPVQKAAAVDSNPPVRPAGVVAVPSADGSVTLTWSASADVGASGTTSYTVYRNGTGPPFFVGDAIGTTSSTGLVDTTAPWGLSYYAVAAWDGAGNLSLLSDAVAADTDSTAPEFPAPPTARPVFGLGLGSTVRVTWEDPTDDGSGVISTALRYGTEAGSPDTLVGVTGTEHTLTSTESSVLWYVSMQAEDAVGNVASTTEVPVRYVSVERVFGDERIATSRAVSARTFDEADAVILASARSYADALCAAPLAGALRCPVLLVAPGPLPPETATEIERLGATHAYVIGGEGVVTAETLLSVQQVLTGAVTRLAGPTRYETAAAVAHELAELESEDPPVAFVVSGQGFPDALSAGAAAYATHGPILYATRSEVPAVSRAAVLAAHAAETVVLGGSGAVTTSAETDLPNVTRLLGADRYATCDAFANWAVGRGFLGEAHAVLVTGRLFPDGLSAAPLAGELGAPIVLGAENRIPATATWFGARRAQIDFVTLVGGTGAVSDAQRDAVWGAMSVP